MGLVEFAAAYDTDKGTTHRYFELYATLLGRHQHTALRVLEIGVLRGGSLALWRDWFTSAEVHGIDPVGARVEDCAVHRLDAYDDETVDALPGPWDVIIDDGPHTVESQAFAAEKWSQQLAVGGTLVIEDIAPDTDVAAVVHCIPDHLRRFASVVDRRLVPGVRFDDDLLVVIDRAAEVV